MPAAPGFRLACLATMLVLGARGAWATPMPTAIAEPQQTTPTLTSAPTTTAIAPEVPPAASLPCFAGAYYRKAVTSTDHWVGMEGVVRLPRPSYDESRRKPATGKMLDNASVYMGGLAGEQEVDAGLTWEVIREADGKVSTERKAFRPFWRAKKWSNAPAKADYYYFPGDLVRMKVDTRKTGTLTLEIEVLERAESSRPLLIALNAAEHPTIFTVTFDVEPFGPGNLQQFKRVNAIDQVGNEGKGVIPTTTTVRGSEWHEVWLLRADGRRLPMAPERYTDMRCPDATHIVVEPTINSDRGGERVDILGTLPPTPTPGT